MRFTPYMFTDTRTPSKRRMILRTSRKICDQTAQQKKDHYRWWRAEAAVHEGTGRKDTGVAVRVHQFRSDTDGRSSRKPEPMYRKNFQVGMKDPAGPAADAGQPDWPDG